MPFVLTFQQHVQNDDVLQDRTETGATTSGSSRTTVPDGLNLQTHHSDPVSDGFGWQVTAELGPDHPTVSMSPRHFAPNDPGLVGFSTGCDCVPAKFTLLATNTSTHNNTIKPA